MPPDFTPAMIPLMRELTLAGIRSIEEVVAGRPIMVQDVVVPATDEGPEVVLTVLRPEEATVPLPVVYFLHPGGMYAGNRFHSADVYTEWVERLGVAVVTVEYRLAPEHPDPAPMIDAYTGLRWVAELADESGFDAERIVVAGTSGGGGMAAGLALLARDRGRPALAGQMLGYPMLDDRNDTVSARAFAGVGIWDRTSNRTGWQALLGDRAGTGAVSPYAAPARALDLSGLPPALVDVGSAETFRDEAIDYAARLLRDGVQTELHVWPGGCHSFDLVAPEADISIRERDARIGWLRRLLER